MCALTAQRDNLPYYQMGTLHKALQLRITFSCFAFREARRRSTMCFHLRTPYTDVTFGVRAELRSPQVVPSYRQRANSPYSQIGTLHQSLIFGPGMSPLSLLVKFLRSPQVVPSYGQRANSPYSHIGTRHKALIFGSGMSPL